MSLNFKISFDFEFKIKTFDFEFKIKSEQKFRAIVTGSSMGFEKGRISILTEYCKEFAEFSSRLSYGAMSNNFIYLYQQICKN